MSIFIVNSKVFGQIEIGCYKSSALNPVLPEIVAKRITSPEKCIQECKARYYMWVIHYEFNFLEFSCKIYFKYIIICTKELNYKILSCQTKYWYLLTNLCTNNLFTN